MLASLTAVRRQLGFRSRRRFQQCSETQQDLHEHGSYIQEQLDVTRGVLDMDVGFVCEFETEVRYFRHVSAKALPSVIRAGDSMPIKGGYCERILDGRFPYMMNDTSANPEAVALNTQLGISIGSYISYPIRSGRDKPYGTFTCFNYKPYEALNVRDLTSFKETADKLSFWLTWGGSQSILRQ